MIWLVAAALWVTFGAGVLVGALLSMKAHTNRTPWSPVPDSAFPQYQIWKRPEWPENETRAA